MSVSIVSCPNCKNVVLSDTLQCPTCDHLLKPEAELLVPVVDSVARAAADRIPCPDCGEMVRKGLVRCWRCGGFLRSDIAEAYQKMQDGPQRVILSQPDAELMPDAAPQSIGDDDDGDEDDFELAPGLNLMSEDELGFSLSLDDLPLAPVAASEPAPQPKVVPPAEDGETYGFKTPVAAPTPVSAKAAEAPAPVPEKTPAASTAAAETKAEPEPAKPAPAKKIESTGDPLLDIAMQEQQEATDRRKDRIKQKRGGQKTALAGYALVYCPNGHAIQVEERYRGMTGRCPKCKSFFHVPAIDLKKVKEDERRAAEEQAKQSKYLHWVADAHLHSLDPTKLKLKPGSMEKDFAEVDLAFSDEHLVIIAHGKQGSGLFKGEKNKKKRDELRGPLQEYLRLDKEILDLPAAGYRDYGKDQLPRIQVVQPAAYAHESIFAGVPVFGEGRVAVRMPVTDQDKDVKDILFISFYLSEFREFSQKLSELYGIKDLGHVEGVPLTDNVSKSRCHYSDRMVESLEVTPFHKADTTMKIEISGRKCAACGLIVSEDARKKEKLGGPAGKSIAKTPCPKCKQKFGDISLFALAKPETEGGADATLAENGGLKSPGK